MSWNNRRQFRKDLLVTKVPKVGRIYKKDGPNYFNLWFKNQLEIFDIEVFELVKTMSKFQEKITYNTISAWRGKTTPKPKSLKSLAKALAIHRGEEADEVYKELLNVIARVKNEQMRGSNE